MEALASLDFLGGVNPMVKTLVYVLILVHLLAVGCWCAIACPTMFKKSESFSDKVEKALKEKNH